MPDVRVVGVAEIQHEPYRDGNSQGFDPTRYLDLIALALSVGLYTFLGSYVRIRSPYTQVPKDVAVSVIAALGFITAAFATNLNHSGVFSDRTNMIIFVITISGSAALVAIVARRRLQARGQGSEV